MSQKTEVITRDASGRRDVSFAAGTQTIADETLEHRRSRLRSTAMILLACFAVVLLNQLIGGDSIWRGQVIALIAVLGGLVALLSSVKQLTETALHGVEAAIVGSSAVWMAGRHYALMASLIESEDRARLLTTASGAVIGFFTLIVVYGLVVPNSWKKTAWVVALLLVYPFCEPLILKANQPGILEIAPEVVEMKLITRHAVFLIVGTIVAVFGTHSLNSLRQQVREAKKVGQYQLEKRIGEGGMGEVWKARHGMLARPAAIKLIRLDCLEGSMEAPATAIQRFEREAQVTASLRCPHTIEVFDFGTTSDGSCYYAMEFLDGLDLDSLVRDHGPVSAGRTVFIWQQICRSLAEAHANGLIHRDIKPANIYLCRLGLELDFVKVLDFGLVTFQETQKIDAKLTQAGVVGTPAFITPEAMLGYEVDGRSDVYATACVAYWLLTGEYVFSGTAMEMATGHARIDPPPPSSRVPIQIPQALEAIIMRCLHKDPDDRPDALALLRDLEETGLANSWSDEESGRWWGLHAS